MTTVLVSKIPSLEDIIEYNKIDLEDFLQTVKEGQGGKGKYNNIFNSAAVYGKPAGYITLYLVQNNNIQKLCRQLWNSGPTTEEEMYLIEI